MTGQKQVWIDVDDQAIGTRPFSPKGQGTMHVAISREPPMGANESNIRDSNTVQIQNENSREIGGWSTEKIVRYSGLLLLLILEDTQTTLTSDENIQHQMIQICGSKFLIRRLEALQGDS